ncbi:unnamed protein product [Gongylonema pulchrum]|uniref:Peptidase_M13 domain-containing protein n=1 Tax=Gongylonema pulchrum TaxID=637853 RepID=A0A183CUD1_9BILA|nr:unnamed protein product [Gongylonema pulchrum]
MGPHETPGARFSISWHRYLSGLLPQNVAEKLDLSKLQINVIDPLAIKAIDEAVRNFHNATLLDYMEWQIILATVPFLDERFRNVTKELENALMGQSELRPMWLRCQNEVSSLFPEVINRLYIGEYFHDENRAVLKQMIDNIKESFAVLIEESTWMDSYVKLQALRKVDAIVPFIGYDDYLLNNTALEVKYAQFDYNSSSDFLGIYRAVIKYRLQRLFNKLLETNERKQFQFPAPQVNAYYDPMHNQIDSVLALLVGILQGTFFNNKMPLSVNYGSIGVVIGHEITHGFDEGGWQFFKAFIRTATHAHTCEL